MRDAITVRTKGTYLGIKINTTGMRYKRQIASIGRGKVVKDLKKKFKEHIRKRIPKLRIQLRDGFKGGRFRGEDLSSMGASKFEMTPKKGHKVHEDVPNIWSRLVSERGMFIRMTGQTDKIDLNMGFYQNRDSSIRFFNTKSGKIPRASTVASRLDETCLRFISEGHFAKVVNNWARLNMFGFYSEIDKYFKGK